MGGEAIGAVRLSSVAVYAPSVRCGLAPGLWGRVAGSATEIMAIGSCLKCTESAASEPLRSSDTWDVAQLDDWPCPQA